MRKHLILLGAPGSGKGTQSAKLTNLDYKHVSTGNLLRDEIAKESELGIKVKEIMESGQLVSDDLVVELLKANLDLNNSAYIFDGYPRNEKQAKTLGSILDGNDYLAVYFKLNTDILVERITNRRMTKDGKHIYNLKTNPPKVSGICDVTGEALMHRDDDQESIVRERMNVFNDTITPMLEYYRGNEKLVVVNADQKPDKVYEEISKII